jgi:predicted enzyme related to lactoylglutathione lyase
VVGRLSLVEFPADDLTRGQRFWAELLGVELGERSVEEGTGVQTHSAASRSASTRVAPAPATGSHCRTSTSTPLPAALQQVVDLGGEIVHPGNRFAVCRDSEGNPFGLAG